MKKLISPEIQMKAIHGMFKLAAEQYLSGLITVRDFQACIERYQLPPPEHGELDPNTGLRASFPWPWPTERTHGEDGFYIGLLR